MRRIAAIKGKLYDAREGRAPGTPEYKDIEKEIWDRTGLGNAVPGATPRARIEIERAWLMEALKAPLRARAGERLELTARVTNLSKRRYAARTTTGRRLVRLGAQLCAPDGALINRDYERAWLPSDLLPGATIAVPIGMTAPDAPGHYRLKFDLVSEGIDWFENSGSEVTVKELVVR